MPFIFDSLLASSGTRLLSPSGDTSVGYLDSPEAVRTLRWLNDYYRDDETKTAPMSFTDAGIQFNNNRTGMIISDLNGYKFYKTRLGDHLGVAPLPRFESGKRVNAIAFGGFGIARHSKHPQAAWKFLEYLTLTENEKAVEFADHYLTTSKSMSEAFHQDTDPVKSIFIKEIDYAVKPLEYHNPFLTLAWNRDLLTEFQSLLMTDHADIPEKLHQLALKLDKELQRSRSEHDRQITNP
jgi:multiple sugar transport system substrate-binding protein